MSFTCCSGCFKDTDRRSSDQHHGRRRQPEALAARVVVPATTSDSQPGAIELDGMPTPSPALTRPAGASPEHRTPDDGGDEHEISRSGRLRRPRRLNPREAAPTDPSRREDARQHRSQPSQSHTMMRGTSPPPPPPPQPTEDTASAETEPRPNRRSLAHQPGPAPPPPRPPRWSSSSGNRASSGALSATVTTAVRPASEGGGDDEEETQVRRIADADHPRAPSFLPRPTSYHGWGMYSGYRPYASPVGGYGYGYGYGSGSGSAHSAPGPAHGRWEPMQRVRSPAAGVVNGAEEVSDTSGEEGGGPGGGR